LEEKENIKAATYKNKDTVGGSAGEWNPHFLQKEEAKAETRQGSSGDRANHSFLSPISKAKTGISVRSYTDSRYTKEKEPCAIIAPPSWLSS
jgi:hypothetical protein